MIAWNDYPVGSHRITCPLCGRGDRDKTAGITIEREGSGVFHCFRCSHVEVNRQHIPTVHRIADAPARTQPAQQNVRLSEWGRELWRNCHPLSGVATCYLRARHCRIPPESGHLRYHPALKHPSGYVGPALVALVTHAVTREHLSLHRTWITPTGKANIDAPRLVLGNHSTVGGCIRLWPDEDVSMGLGIAEGIETALSLAWGYTPVWSTIDAGHMAKFPVLAGIDTLVIAQDRDPAGMAAAANCANRWAASGRGVLLTQQAANDLNDELKQVAA